MKSFCLDTLFLLYLLKFHWDFASFWLSLEFKKKIISPLKIYGNLQEFEFRGEMPQNAQKFNAAHVS